jgi:hypothetical protein
MMEIAAQARLTRRFSVHGVDEAPSRGCLVQALNFEDAALAFVEARHLTPGDGGEVALMVEDCGTGERQCFEVDLATGEAGPCD